MWATVSWGQRAFHANKSTNHRGKPKSKHLSLWITQCVCVFVVVFFGGGGCPIGRVYFSEVYGPKLFCFEVYPFFSFLKSKTFLFWKLPACLDDFVSSDSVSTIWGRIMVVLWQGPSKTTFADQKVKPERVQHPVEGGIMARCYGSNRCRVQMPPSHGLWRSPHCYVNIWHWKVKTADHTLNCTVDSVHSSAAEFSCLCNRTLWTWGATKPPWLLLWRALTFLHCVCFQMCSTEHSSTLFDFSPLCVFKCAL